MLSFALRVYFELAVQAGFSKLCRFNKTHGAYQLGYLKILYQFRYLKICIILAF